MPLFDFICRDCAKEFETLVMGSEIPKCPSCGSFDLVKQMSAFAARTRGGKDSSASGGGSKCSGCSGKSCRTCH